MRSAGERVLQVFFSLTGTLFPALLFLGHPDAEALVRHRRSVPFFVSDYFLSSELDFRELRPSSLDPPQPASLEQKSEKGVLIKITGAELERLLNPKMSNALVPAKVHVSLDSGASIKAFTVISPNEGNRATRTKRAVKNLLRLCKGSYLTEKEIKRIVEFIEHQFPFLISRGCCYAPPHLTGLKAAVEFDPETEQYFIHLVHSIGSGCNKTVFRSILYGIEMPHFVATARSRENLSLEREIAILRSLQHIERALFLIAAPKRNPPAMITNLCEGGSLQDIELKRSFTIREKIALAKDLMEALMAIERASTAHLDIHDGNLFLDDNDDEALQGIRYRLVLGDWGAASAIDEENRHRVRKDLYAAGVTLYALFHDIGYPAELYARQNQFKELCKERPGAGEGGELLIGELSPDLTERKERLDLEFNLRGLCTKDAFERAILHMMHPYYKEERDAAFWYMELDILLRNSEE